MLGSKDQLERERVASIQIEDCLIVWRGAGIVLIGEIESDRWIVARGWLGSDQLTDVRRWLFTTPNAFGGQFRRLVHEATGDPRAAQAAGAAATGWALALAES